MCDFNIYGNDRFMLLGVRALVRDVYQELLETAHPGKKNLPDFWVLSEGDDENNSSFLRDALIQGRPGIIWGSGYLKLLLKEANVSATIAVLDTQDSIPTLKNELRAALESEAFSQKRIFQNPDDQRAIKLSRLEKWVLTLIMNGYSTDEIAFWMDRDVKLIYGYRRSIMSKVKVKTVQELFFKAAELGFRYGDISKIMPGDMVLL